MLNYIKNFIRDNEQAIPLDKFIDIALYHENFGYYMSKSPIGIRGDFITAPEISQIFGEVIAIWSILVWENMGSPSNFILAELGPGRATLTLDIIRATQKFSNFFKSMNIHLVECSPVLRQIQQEKLKGYNVIWHDKIETLPIEKTIFIANEFFDALPIKQFVFSNTGWMENFVTIDENNKFKIITKNVSHNINIENVPIGAILEISYSGQNIMKIIHNKILQNGGAALIIDYGYINSKYTSTIQAIKNHRYSNFLENIGDSDITSHVDFGALQKCLTNVSSNILTQREFLYAFGIKERLEILLKKSSDTQKENLISSFLRLTENMGSMFKVLMVNVTFNSL